MKKTTFVKSVISAAAALSIVACAEQEKVDGLAAGSFIQMNAKEAAAYGLTSYSTENISESTLSYRLNDTIDRKTGAITAGYNMLYLSKDKKELRLESNTTNYEMSVTNDGVSISLKTDVLKAEGGKELAAQSLKLDSANGYYKIVSEDYRVAIDPVKEAAKAKAEAEAKAKAEAEAKAKAEEAAKKKAEAGKTDVAKVDKPEDAKVEDTAKVELDTKEEVSSEENKEEVKAEKLNTLQVVMKTEKIEETNRNYFISRVNDRVIQVMVFKEVTADGITSNILESTTFYRPILKKEMDEVAKDLKAASDILTDLKAKQKAKAEQALKAAEVAKTIVDSRDAKVDADAAVNADPQNPAQESDVSQDQAESADQEATPATEAEIMEALMQQAGEAAKIAIDTVQQAG